MPAFEITLNLRYACKTMAQYHIIGSYNFCLQHITDKDGEKMNQNKYTEWDEFLGLSEEELDWLTTNHTEAEWEERDRQRLREADYTEEEIKEYFYYDSAKHKHYPTEKLIDRLNELRRLAQKMKNLYLEAISLNIADAFERLFDEALLSVVDDEPEIDIQEFYKMFPHLANAEPDEDDLEYWEAMEGLPEPTAEEIEKSATHNERITTLSNRGLSIVNFDSPTTRDIDTTHTIDGVKYIAADILYYGGKEIGIFFDEYSMGGETALHERHVDAMLKIAAQNNIPLVLIYWEPEDKPIWEIYLDGKFVRQQPTVYSYDGYEYDKKKLSRKADLAEDDIGSNQKVLMELNTEAEDIVYGDEKAIRKTENKQEHDELAEEASRLQKEHQQLVSVFRKLNASAGDVFDEEYRNSACAALDTFSETIVPGLIASAYEEKAKKIYPFYPKVALSSQRYLLTAVALEEHLTAEHYDICPLYIELCRVFENELDIRIFSEYTNELLNLKEFKLQQGDHDEPCYRIIQQSVVKARREKAQQKKEKNNTKAKKDEIKVFVPERMKIKSLYKVEDDIGAESICQTRLLYFLKARQYKLEEFTDKTKFDAAYEYVENRNRFTHPDDKSDAADLQKELQSIKEQTNARMEWLIKATQGQE